MGILSGRVQVDIERADCDDNNPNVTPLTERYIPAGEFLRGENNTLGAVLNEPLNCQIIASTYTKTTNQQFSDFMNDMIELGFDNVTEEGLNSMTSMMMTMSFPERIVMTHTGFGVMEGYEQHPVNEVFKWSGDSYCEFMGQILPTEAQWEKQPVARTAEDSCGGIQTQIA